MDYDINYIEASYNPEELYELFIKEFIRFRKENNLTQHLMAKYTSQSRTSIARIECKSIVPSVISMLKILGPLGYTLKIEKIDRKTDKEMEGL